MLRKEIITKFLIITNSGFTLWKIDEETDTYYLYKRKNLLTGEVQTKKHLK